MWRWRKKEKEKWDWIYFIWVHEVFEALEIWIFLAPRRIFSLWLANSWLPCIGTSSLTRDQTGLPLRWEFWVLATGLPGKSQAWNLLNKLIKYFTNLRHLWGGRKKKRERKMAPRARAGRGDAKDGARGVLWWASRSSWKHLLSWTPAP